MTDTDDREIIGNRHHEGGRDADPVGHLITDCDPRACGLVAMTSPLPGCQHPDCEPEPASAVALRNLGDGDPYLVCGAHQWSDALALCDGDDRAALALITASDTPAARPDGLRERPLLLLAADPATGQVLAAWIDTAYGPGGLVAQIAGRPREDLAGRRRDPCRWMAVPVDVDPAGDVHVRLDLSLCGAVPCPAEDPPRRRSIAERQAEQVAIALGLQAAIIGGEPRAVFHGLPDGDPDVGQIVIEDHAGRQLDLLANAGLFHSPGGFGWGGLGSGPSATARSLLAAALGADAACPVCRGTHQLTVPEAGGEGAYDTACTACDDGIRRLPYKTYAAEVVARLHGEWALTRGDVLRWLAVHPDALFDAVRALAGELLS
jgi:hypothetical protein